MSIKIKLFSISISIVKHFNGRNYTWWNVILNPCVFLFISPVLLTINAVYHEKSLISNGATFREKLVSNHRAVHQVD